MYRKNKVIWSEGMLLQQQHLQQHDRYLHTQLEMRARTQQRDDWGVSRLRIDANQLSLGKLALLECDAVMPDGTPLSLPRDGDLPLPLRITSEMRDCEIVLALPLERPGMPESGNGDYARYGIVEHEVADNTHNAGTLALMQVGRLRLKLAPAAEMTEAHTTIGIARVLECSADNRVHLDETYIPSCIDHRASPTLERFVGELSGLLRQRADLLASRLSQANSNSVARIADFLLLQLLNRNQPLFGHLAHSHRLHPETLFRACLQLVGELSSFDADKRPPPLPEYRHHALEHSFMPLMSLLRQQLSMVSAPSAVSIKLQNQQHGRYIAEVADTSLFAHAQFVLAAKAELPDDVLISHLPLKAKIGPVEQIVDLVNLQLPAIGLLPLANAPQQIPLHNGYRYFALDTQHTLWAQLASSAGMALHVAGEFPGLELECWAILHMTGSQA